MKEDLYTILAGTQTTIGVEDLVIRVVMAVVMGLVIFASYWLSHTGTIYSKKFNVTLVVLTILTAAVMTVIGSNIALSLGMVGALSIVRFRTAIKDARDTAYIFWAIVAGICCGVGSFIPAAVGSAAVFVVLLALGRIRNDVRTLIVVRVSTSHLADIEGCMYKFFNGKAEQRVKNTTAESAELIYELSRMTLIKAEKNVGTTLVEALYKIDGVEYVNIVAQNDEIGS